MTDDSSRSRMRSCRISQFDKVIFVLLLLPLSQTHVLDQNTEILVQHPHAKRRYTFRPIVQQHLGRFAELANTWSSV